MAQGKRSLAEGTTTLAKGAYSHAEGGNSVALGAQSHAEGYATTAQGISSHAEGRETITQNSKYEPSSGSGGSSGSGDGTGSGGEIIEPTYDKFNTMRGEAAHSEGYASVSTGFGAHSEGGSTIANGHFSHSEGDSTRAQGNGAHSEGGWTSANGDFSSAHGYHTNANAKGSATFGLGTAADNEFEMVVGKYNKYVHKSLFNVGYGDSDDDRKTAFSVDADGKVKVYNVPVGDDDVVRKQDVCMNISDGTGENSLIQKAPDGKENSAAMEGGVALGKYSYANQRFDFAIGSRAIAGFTEEQFNQFYWDSSTNTPLHNGKGKATTGEILDEEGDKYINSYGYNRSFGHGSIAQGRYAVAFQQGKARDKFSVAFHDSDAAGVRAFATGKETYAGGENSFTQGETTYANYKNQAVFGQYNENKEDSIFEVGVGSGEPDPTYGLPETKNAFEVTKTGKVKALNAPVDSDDVVRLSDLESYIATNITNVLNTEV